MYIKKTPKNICILTGAGISSESGIRTFRDQNGLWEDHDIFEVASPIGFRNDPELVYRFYNERRKQLLSDEVHPNDAHHSLAKLVESKNHNVSIITQNVDNLHERANPKGIIHMHGELLKCRCTKTSKVYDCLEEIDSNTRCKCCHERGNLRPHIVWFGEQPLYMEEIEKLLSECDLFISIGTSGEVYPAANFVDLAKSCGAYTVEINLNETSNGHKFDCHINGKAGEKVEELVQEILSS